MIKILKALLVSWAIIMLASCATDMVPSTTARIIWDEGADYSELVAFAVGDILTAMTEDDVQITEGPAQWTVSFNGINHSMEEQAYSIVVEGHDISITAGDGAGLMYGGLEVAEMISLYGMEGVITESAEPYIYKRSFQFDVVLDFRTPSYASVGDAGQNNVENMWDLGFWKEFFDTAARMRYNDVHLWAMDIFPSIIKVEGYEDVALNDVWKTNIPYDNNYRGDMVDCVRPEHYENYEVVKKMTIEEKIDFWREVMAYAKTRGIDIVIGVHHLYVDEGENGKYGISNDPNNEITKDYLAKSMQALIETYPDLSGVCLNDGEHMSWDTSTNATSKNAQWIHDVYVPAINAALIKEPGREFSVSINNGLYPNALDLFADCKASRMEANGGFTGTHMYANSQPLVDKDSYRCATEGIRMWYGLRNEDSFDVRWGDVDFVRELMHNLPSKETLMGFTTGFDGYCLGRDYSSTDPDCQGMLYIKKHWYNYTLLGRLGFEPDMPDKKMADIFAEHFSSLKTASEESLKELNDITSLAGKIIPQVHKIYFRANGDYTWYVAACYSHPNTFGYIDITKWIKGNNVYQEGDVGPLCMSIEDYALAVSKSESIVTDLQLPTEVAGNLFAWSAEVLERIETLDKTVRKNKRQDLVEKDFP